MLIQFVIVANIFVFVNCFDQALLGQSVLYGISYLARENGNFSGCYKELVEFLHALEVQKPWALKGNLSVNNKQKYNFFLYVRNTQFVITRHCNQFNALFCF